MKLLTISKILLIIALPFLIFLLASRFSIFNDSFYKEEFSNYGIEKEIPKPMSLHAKVINFIIGKSNELPNNFNEREKKHLFDVRKVINTSLIALYFLIGFFVVLTVVSMLKLKTKDLILSFAGKSLFFGGILTITVAIAVFILINADFSTTFESFHRLLFEKGTYIFDPKSEMLVTLYPEQLFMDLGIKISKLAIFVSIVIMSSGIFLILKSKRINNKKNFNSVQQN